MNYKLIGSTTSTVILGAPLLVMTFYFGSTPQDHCLNIMLLIVALLLGWVLGILVTPYDGDEQKQFTNFSKAISAFISGFVVAKIDKLVEHILDPTVLADSLALFRLTLFVAGFLLALIITFIYRRYA
jgi:hypothetical protein